jgi:hypothetical protein
MRISPLFWPAFRAVAATGLVLCLMPACKPAAPPASAPKPAVASTIPAVTHTNQTPVEYVSVFTELMPPKGRDPFYPNSHRRDVVPVVNRGSDRPVPVAAALQIQGIVGTPAHRLVIINGTIFETGEEDTVRVPDGKLKVKCLEIGEDYAVVMAQGETQPKRLEISKKGF